MPTTANSTAPSTMALTCSRRSWLVDAMPLRAAREKSSRPISNTPDQKWELQKGRSPMGSCVPRPIKPPQQSRVKLALSGAVLTRHSASSAAKVPRPAAHRAGLSPRPLRQAITKYYHSVITTALLTSQRPCCQCSVGTVSGRAGV